MHNDEWSANLHAEKQLLLLLLPTLDCNSGMINFLLCSAASNLCGAWHS
jgi:hypothetical protein